MPLQPALRAPAPRLLFCEARFAVERAYFSLRARTLLRDLPRGAAQAVLIAPGLYMGPRSIEPLRAALCALGYHAVDWGAGRNLGMSGALKNELAQRLRGLHATHGPVTLIGWSLGGVFVREMARHQPQLVRRVITLGSPINGHPDANNMVLVFKLAARGKAVKTDLEGFARRIAPPPLPCTAIHTRSDGIVAWQASLEDPAPNTENLEVDGSHFGLPSNLQVLRLIAERLAQES